MNRYGISEELLEKFKQLFALDASLDAQYPALADIHTLSAKEVLALAAADDGELREQFEMRDQEMRDQAVSGMFTDLFPQLPPKVQRSILICVRNNMLISGWSADFRHQVLSEMIQECKLKLSIADVHICPHCETAKCSGPGELCSADWTPCGCNDFHYPCDSSHSTLERCRDEDCVDYLKQYRVCVGHTCVPNET